MATYIFGGLTAVILILSAWMGYKNKAEYEDQIKLDVKTEKNLKSKQGELTELQELRDEAIQKKEADLAENTAQSEKLEALTSELDGLQSALSEKESVAAANQAKIDERNEVLSGLPDPDVLVPQLDATKKSIASLKTEIQSTQDELASVTQQQENAESLAESKRELIKLQTSGKSLPTLSTTVKTVYRNWGFVTLNGGNAHGVVPGSVLDVLRNGEVVAKLKVTAVEQNRAAADILADAVPVTVALRSGDRVVAEKVAN